MKTINERLNDLITTLGYNITSFSKELGYTNNNVTIGRIVNDKDKMPSADTMLKIAHRFNNVNLDWLLTGEGEMLKNTEKQSGTHVGDNAANALVVGGNISGNNTFQHTISGETIQNASTNYQETIKKLQQQIENQQQSIEKLLKIIDKLTDK
jgi:transcriptional regulator with XRE-family HTH domain